MSLRRLRAILLRVIQETRRDRPSLALLFVAPIVITGLVTFIVRESETPSVSAAVVSRGRRRRRRRGDHARTGAGECRGDRRRCGGRRRGALGCRSRRSRCGHPPAGRHRLGFGDDHRADERPRSVRGVGPAARGLAGDPLRGGRCRRRPAADDRARHRLRHREQRPDRLLRAGHRRLLRVLLRLHPHRRELPAGADGWDAGTPDGDPGHEGRGRRRLHHRVLFLRDDPGRHPHDLGARHGPRAEPSGRCRRSTSASASRSPAARSSPTSSCSPSRWGR